MISIQIDNGPDFCMKRGQEILSYHAKCGVIGSNQTVSITDRSLIMLVRKIGQGIPRYLKSVKAEVTMEAQTDTKFRLKYSDKGIEFQLVWFPPNDLSQQQVSRLTDIMEKYINAIL